MSRARDDCGCDGTPPQPARPDNRPGLAQVHYRIGRHGDFLARMVAALPTRRVPDPRAGDAPHTPLGRLTARDLDDATVALLDAWAASLDVLAFYQERIANEGLLGTALERLSLRELARAVGYELRPGVAAETRLAFTVESADDPFRAVTVPRGTRTMSVPKAPGDLPQVYETLEEIVARADFNAIPARLERPQHLALQRASPDDDPLLVLINADDSIEPTSLPDPASGALSSLTESNRASFFPLDPAFDPGTLLAERAEDTGTALTDVAVTAVVVDEIQLRGTATGLRGGDRLLAVGVHASDVAVLPLVVKAVATDPAYGLTNLVVAPLGTSRATGGPPPITPIRPSLSLAYRTPVLRRPSFARTPQSLDGRTLQRELRRTNWPARDLETFVALQRWSIPTLLAVVRQPPPAESLPLGAARPGLFAFGDRLGFFGNTAPKQESLADPSNQRGSDGYTESWDGTVLDEDGTVSDEVTPRPIWRTSQGDPPGSDGDVFLERAVEDIAPESWAVIETPDGPETRHLTLRISRSATVSRTDFGTTGKVTALVFRTPRDEDFDEAGAYDHFTFRRAQANVASAPLTLAGLPIRAPLAEGDREVTLDRLVLELLPGRAVAVAGERTDAAGVAHDEIALLDDVRHVGGLTRLTFTEGLSTRLARPSVRVNANVARASHGETTTQILGSGDAAVANQAFALQKLPLTFLAAAEPPGVLSTLEVKVDGIRWEERPSLYEAGPQDRVYCVRLDEDGTTRVIFGDGVRGARLPTGERNIEATHRVGIGAVGEVPADAVTMLKTRPLGVRGVTNPNAASGAAEGETPAEVRENAPSSVRTLGRIVSLTDYEDAARTWPGFAKARAETVRVGDRRVVHVTVALASGRSPVASDAALASLRTAIDAIRDGGDEVAVSGFRKVPFGIEARLRVASAYGGAGVETAARAALDRAFGFDAAGFGAPVTGARVLAVLQDVAGVSSVDLDAVAVVGTTADDERGHSALLTARPAEPDGAGGFLGAELLVLSPLHVALTVEVLDVR